MRGIKNTGGTIDTVTSGNEALKWSCWDYNTNSLQEQVYDKESDGWATSHFHTLSSTTDFTLHYIFPLAFLSFAIIPPLDAHRPYFQKRRPKGKGTLTHASL